MEVKTKRLYVVDDDEIFHFIIKKLLNRQGHVEVTSFLCAEEALEKLRQPDHTMPSLIVLDMNMQRMSGWDFIEAFRGIRPRAEEAIPIIMCSSSIDVRDMLKVQRTPELSAYITKPLDASKIKVIAEYL